VQVEFRVVNTIPAAVRRPRRPGVPVGAGAGVADPSRGSAVALGFPLLALALVALWVARDGVSVDVGPVTLVGLLATSALAERIALQLGPRSWYTASTPAVVLTGVLGGPLAGAAAGLASQTLRRETVWRRRLAEGGLASLQGVVAGWCALAAWPGPSGTIAIAALALASAVAVNTIGRLLIMVERRTPDVADRLRRGLVVDCTEALLVTPLLGMLVLTEASSQGLVLASVAALLATLTIVQRMRERSMQQLAAEQENARRDQLTGAPNRRAFEEILAVEHARVVRGGQPAGVFVADIDRFKSINDRYTHRVGDEVLVAVVQRLTEGLRATDTVARWGGEEIAVLAPGLRGRRALEQYAERVRLLIGAEPLALSRTAVPVTVSVGGTLLDGSLTPQAAFDQADRALYDAKRTRDASVVTLPSRLTLRLSSA
jgi:diguanylate cyclase (GGDEF)-like protein